MSARANSIEVRGAGSVLSSLVQLTKPGVTRMVIATTLGGAILAPGAVSLGLLGVAIAGTTLVVAAANVLNMVLEVDVDGRMSRTRTRPLPAGKLAPEDALRFGLVLGGVGLLVLAVFVNAVTAGLGAAALLIYVLGYTPMKRHSPWAVWVGAVPGAVPPLMGWTSMSGALDAAALSIFALLFVWQVPHFHAIAIFRRSEYEAAGLAVLPVVRGLDHTKVAIVATVLLQLVVSALPAFFGLGGAWYLATAASLGVLYLGWALWGLRPSAAERWARSFFFASMPYLLLLFAALLVDAR